MYVKPNFGYINISVVCGDSTLKKTSSMHISSWVLRGMVFRYKLPISKYGSATVCGIANLRVETLSQIHVQKRLRCLLTIVTLCMWTYGWQCQKRLRCLLTIVTLRRWTDGWQCQKRLRCLLTIVTLHMRTIGWQCQKRLRCLLTIVILHRW